MNMIERVARAQAEVCSDCKKLGKVDWEAHLEDAKAAIQAMREPTEEMLFSSRNLGVNNFEATQCYTAMIDAALKE